MKGWIHSKVDIYAMSIERSKARQKIDSLSEIILEHVCKCVLYKNSTGDYHHWIYDEIATWLSYINDLTIKPKNNKLKAKEYDQLVFGTFGDDMADAQLNLELIYRKCRNEYPPYPKVDITSNMKLSMLDITLNLKSTIPDMLASKNDLTKSDFGNNVQTIFDKYLQ